MNKGKAVSTEKINPLFEKLEQLSKAQRIGIWVGILILVIVGFVYFSYLPMFKQIDKLNANLAKVEKELEVAKKNARQLNDYRKKMQDAEEQFKIVMRALPEKEEIPTLLTGISKAGKDSGLTFVLFQPKPEVKKDFYAEIPLALRVTGDYHGVATFFESVAGLNRIVNIRDINLTPEKGGKSLTTTCTAVTYKFIEASNTKKKPSKRSRRK
ncbi:type 4a pilus biogenesis protein PilO [Desulfosarcina ovata]|uniref:Pilus assembly protein PilO n=2 Tax=Desulfosarcina ovata TaxID=83564 RepID=A0A5K8AE38_9BACT|nr:type 4a pilus biogenesis protein PilO [Desulfosarcina ovata]BBO84307.1 pilus assembly protein PilO [Desulfosarcina ovata subsp. sediminis]BBO90819.1 pilus assembly protein PilO [Desulfosarcina ovata subsp. ovata]